MHIPQRPSDSDVARAREVVLRQGWNATCYQILNPGIELWFAPDADAVVGYVTVRRMRVVAGAPVCAENDLATVVELFEADAAANGTNVCYFGAEARLEALLQDSLTHSAISLGAQPAWDPSGWPAILASRASLRAQLNRARNKGVRIEEWPAVRAQNNPELEMRLREWLDARPLPPLHFLVEPDTLGRLADRRVLVACKRDVVVAFLVASPIPRRNGWLIEQIIRGNDAPNGTSELLLDAAFGLAARSGHTYLTLGLSPLSTRAAVASITPPEPAIARLLSIARLHGRRFYNFDGLDAFKSKFNPDVWEPVYAFVNEPRFTMRTLMSIARAFSGQSTLKMIGEALRRMIS